MGELRGLGQIGAARTLTVLPALARRVGADAYARLAIVPLLRTHWLVAVRAA